MQNGGNSKLAVVLDAMGGDFAPTVPVEGAVLAAGELGLNVYLVGKEDEIVAELSKYRHAELPIEVVHASQVIGMAEHPATAAKRKKDSSVVKGLELVRQGKANAFVSMGNTGAVMAASLFGLGRIPGVKRPALSTVFPTNRGFCLLLDIGANVDCRPEYLGQFGMMGSIYAERVLGIENPRLGIVSNGEEEGKGSELVKEAYQLLKAGGLNFVGNIEGKDIPSHQADVVVTDGFTGNVIIKTSEGIARLIKEHIREEIMRNPVSILGGLLMKGAFARVSRRTDYSEFGGAVLLGVNGIVIIGHGRSNAWAVRSALRVASQAVNSGVVEAIQAGVNPKKEE